MPISYKLLNAYLNHHNAYKLLKFCSAKFIDQTYTFV